MGLAVVAPHVGAWIEMVREAAMQNRIKVAPHVGAWIEIGSSYKISCSLKVAPHVGAWIEMKVPHDSLPARQSHLT